MFERIPQKIKKILKRIGVVAFLVITVLSVAITYSRGVSTEETKECYRLGLYGEYSIDGGKSFDSFEDVIYINTSKSDNLIIKGHFDMDIPAGEMVHLFLSNDKVNIFINEELVFEKTADRYNPWNTFVADRTVREDDEITIEMTAMRHHLFNQSFSKTYSRIYYGTKYGLLKTMLLRNIIQILGCFLIAVLGCAILINAVALKRFNTIDTEGMIYLGIMLIIGAMTCFINYEYITLLNPNYMALKYVDALTQALSTIFISLNFVKFISNYKAKRRFLHLIWLMTGLTMLYIIWQMLYVKTPDVELNLFSFLTVFGAVIILVQFVVVFSNVKEMSINNRISFDTSLCLVGAALFEIVHFILTGEYLIYILLVALILFSLFQYNMITISNARNLRDAQKTYALEQELTESQIRMMLSQIQPHFLYNALGTIRALCVRDPKEARNAMDHFARYLRANMDSLNEHWCIPFNKELEHVKSYLYIEKLRFEDMLNVEYDIKATDFEIPPLALQTMVENAVKHGLLPKENGGTIKISTYETDTCFEIVVADDGIGFDQSVKKPDDGRSHIGIANTRQRIMGMCNGSLNIGSKCGVGTTITITLPKMSNTRM